VLTEAVERGLRPRVFLSLIGDLHLREGRPKLAAEALVNALALGQPDVPARIRLGDAYSSLRAHHHAAREYALTAERHPSSAQAHDALGKFLNGQGRHGEAAAEFRRAVELAPSEPVFWNNLGVAHRLAREYEEALAALAEASRLAPRMVDPYYNRGEIARALGREEDARRQFLLALEIDPGFQPARAALEGVTLID
jgi:tetratricopeptide (TPR) repeat protein